MYIGRGTTTQSLLPTFLSNGRMKGLRGLIKSNFIDLTMQYPQKGYITTTYEYGSGGRAGCPLIRRSADLSACQSVIGEDTDTETLFHQ